MPEFTITVRADCAECDWWVEADTEHEVEKELRRHFRMCHPSDDTTSVGEQSLGNG